MNDHMQNYPTHDLELAVIIHALKISRHYLLGSRFSFMSVHNGLQYLFDQWNLNGRHAQWLAMISEFHLRLGTSKETRIECHILLAGGYR